MTPNRRKSTPRKVTAKVEEEKPTPIQSLNPDFTELLLTQPEDGLVRRMHPVYSSADDGLPEYVYSTPQEWMFPVPKMKAPATSQPPLILEATAIQSPTDTNPKGWPARNAEPTQIAITGSIPVVPDGD